MIFCNKQYKLFDIQYELFDRQCSKCNKVYSSVMDSTTAVSVLNSYFDCIYATEVYNRSKFELKPFCYGCQIDSLSPQINHTCVLSKSEQIEGHFEQIIDIVDEDDIVKD